MGSGQVFRPHFASPLHPWLGGDKGVVGGSSPSWHSPFTKPPYAHSSGSPAPHSNSYSSYPSSGIFSAFTKEEGMGAGGGASGATVGDYSMGSGGTDGSELKGTPMLSPLGACANKSGREGGAFCHSSGGAGGGEASTPLLPSYPHYPGSLAGGGHDFPPTSYYPSASHFNKSLGQDKPKNKPRSSAGKTDPCFVSPQNKGSWQMTSAICHEPFKSP